MQEITKKLSDISMIMGDGYHFLNMRLLLEGIESSKENLLINKAALDMVSQFHNLCKAVEEGKFK